MLKNKFRIAMAQKNISSITEMATLTGLSRTPLNKLWHNENVESVKLETFAIICEKLEIKLSDLIEYEPTKKDG